MYILLITSNKNAFVMSVFCRQYIPLKRDTSTRLFRRSCRVCNWGISFCIILEKASKTEWSNIEVMWYSIGTSTSPTSASSSPTRCWISRLISVTEVVSETNRRVPCTVLIIARQSIDFVNEDFQMYVRINRPRRHNYPMQIRQSILVIILL